MSELISGQDVQNCIYRIRGKQVMLDSDLALHYGVETKSLKRGIRRNIERFPPDFMFVLTRAEQGFLRRQIGTLSQGQHAKYPSYALTQEGVAMLSSVLRSHRAIRVNIAIMRAFVKLRHAMLAHQGIARRVEKFEGKVDMHETDIRLLVRDQLNKPVGPGGPINPSIL